MMAEGAHNGVAAMCIIDVSINIMIPTNFFMEQDPELKKVFEHKGYPSVVYTIVSDPFHDGVINEVGGSAFDKTTRLEMIALGVKVYINEIWCR